MGSSASTPRVRNVGLFWDLTSCSFPPNTSEADAQACCVRLKNEFIAEKSFKLSYFGVAVDEARVSEARLSDAVTSEDVNELIVCPESEIVGKIYASVIKWLTGLGISEDIPAVPDVNDPQIVLLSGNGSFRALLNRIRYRLKVEILIVHPGATEIPDLSLLASQTLPFSKFLSAKPECVNHVTDTANCQLRIFQKNEEGGMLFFAERQRFRNTVLKYRGDMINMNDKYAVVTIPALEVEKAIDALTQEFRSIGRWIGVETVDPDSEASASNLETTTPEIQPGMKATHGKDELLKAKTGEDLHSSNQLKNRMAGVSSDGNVFPNSSVLRKDHLAERNARHVNSRVEQRPPLLTNPFVVEPDVYQLMPNASANGMSANAHLVKEKSTFGNPANKVVPVVPLMPNSARELVVLQSTQNIPSKHWKSQSPRGTNLRGVKFDRPNRSHFKNSTTHNRPHKITAPKDANLNRDSSNPSIEMKQPPRESLERKPPAEEKHTAMKRMGQDHRAEEKVPLLNLGVVQRPPLLPTPFQMHSYGQFSQEVPAIRENLPNVQLSKDNVFDGNPGNKVVPMKPFIPNPSGNPVFRRRTSQMVSFKYSETQRFSVKNWKGKSFPSSTNDNNKSRSDFSPQEGTAPSDLLPISQSESTEPFKPITGKEVPSLKTTGNEPENHPAEDKVFNGDPGNKPVEMKPFVPKPSEEKIFRQSEKNVPAKNPRKSRTLRRGAKKFEGNVVPPPGNLVPYQVSTKPFPPLTGNEGLSLKPTGNEPAFKKYDAVMMPQTNPRDLIRLSILPKGFCISMKRAQKEYSVALKYFESLPGTCVEYELPEDELDDFQIISECGAVLRAAKKENVGSSLFVEFGNPNDVEKLKKLRGNSIVISPSEPGIKKKFSWRGVGSVRLLWPLDNPIGRAVVEFPDGESAKYAFDRVFGEDFFVSVWISEMNQNYFPVKVLRSADDAAKMEVVGFPPLVHSSAIRAAFQACDVDMKDVKITLGYKEKNASNTIVKVKKELFSYIGKLALNKYSVQFDHPAESEGNGRGSILMAEPLEVLLCVERIMADLRIPEVLIDCDFTVEIPILRKLYGNEKAFEVLNAIVLEKGQGDVAWLTSDDSGVSEFVSLRIGSNLLGKLNRVVKDVGSVFSGVVVNIPENVHQWLRNTEAGKQLMEERMIFFQLGKPTVPKFLEKSGTPAGGYPNLSLKTHDFDVSSGLIGLTASKLGIRFSDNVRPDLRTWVDLIKCSFKLTYLKNEENDELAEQLVAHLEQIAENSKMVQEDGVCVFCSKEVENSVQLECGHDYCKSCFLTLCFWSPMLLRCFAKDCTHLLTCTELKLGVMLFSVLDPEAGKIFEEKIVKFLNIKANKTYVLFPCPTFGCTGLIAGEKDPKEIRVICEKCSVEVCLLCRCHFHIAESCELHQLSMKSSESKIEKWLQNGCGKRGLCKFCNNPVESREGPVGTLPVYCLNCSLVLKDEDFIRFE